MQDTQAWLFQANPDYYDLRSALLDLQELSWVVNQYRNQIRQGDRVYLVPAPASTMSGPSPHSTASRCESDSSKPGCCAPIGPMVRLNRSGLLDLQEGQPAPAQYL